MTVLDGDLDERVAAKAALDAAEEELKSVCASHASTFVAVERRRVALATSLQSLLHSVEDAKPIVEIAKINLEISGGSGGGGGGGGGVGGIGGVDTDKDSSASSSSSSLAELAERHRLRRRTLLQHSSLLELLELPGLMDACVRSNLYDEALSIAAFANSLERRHSLTATDRDHTSTNNLGDDNKDENDKSKQSGARGGGNVVESVILEIRRREIDLRKHLLYRLKNDVTMPQCLEVVAALRRLNGVELERLANRNKQRQHHGGNSDNGVVDMERAHAAMELRLQVDFLEARDVWLDAPPSAITSSAAGSASSYSAWTTTNSSSTSGIVRQTSAATTTAGQSEQILDGIDRYRTRCFEIATQFLAIFRSSQSSSSSSTSNLAPGASTSLPPSTHSSSTIPHQDQSLTLLSMWTTRRIQTFLSNLSIQLSSHITDTASLRDVLDSVSFFATSMGRIGADFRPLLSGLFESKSVLIVSTHWNNGVAALRETLTVCRDAGVAGPLFSGAAAAASSLSIGASDGDDNDKAVEEEGKQTIGSMTSPPPPRKLLSLPPLARLVNAYLTGLNELRRCLLPGTFHSLRMALHRMIQDVRMTLQSNDRAVSAPGLRGEATKLREVSKRMMHEFDECVEPYFRRCLDVALGCLMEQQDDHDKEEEEEEKKVSEVEEEEEDVIPSVDMNQVVQDGKSEKIEGGKEEEDKEKSLNTVDTKDPDISGQATVSEDDDEGDAAEEVDSVGVEDVEETIM